MLGSLFGILAAQKLTQYRLVQAETKINGHEVRIRKLETDAIQLEGRVKESEHDIAALKKFHPPKP